MLRFEELSRGCFRDSGLVEDFQHFALERLLSVMPQGPHFLEMLVIEVRDQSLHQFPPWGIEKGKVVHHLVQPQTNTDLPIAFVLGYFARQRDATGSIVLMMSSTMPLSSMPESSTSTPAIIAPVATSTRTGPGT